MTNKIATLYRHIVTIEDDSKAINLISCKETTKLFFSDYRRNKVLLEKGKRFRPFIYVKKKQNQRDHKFVDFLRQISANITAINKT